MKIGGYQIIDLENRQFTLGVGQQYKGLYEKIEGTRKPTLLSGINFMGSEIHDIFVTFLADGSNFVAHIPNVSGSTVVVTISDLDVVTVSVEQVEE